MATVDLELVEISLLSGRSARPSVTFTPGAPAPTVSVGSVAQWSVTADGVEPIHVFLAFDGQAVHVAAALPEAPIMLAGAPVGTAWTRAPVPCELRFGGACLILRRIPRPGALAQEDATMHDGGALLLAAQQRASQTPPPITQPLGLRGTTPNVPSVRPAAGAPPDTARDAAPRMTHAPLPGTPDMGSTVPLADPHGFHEAVLAATAAAGARPRRDSSPAPDSAPTQVRAPMVGAPQPPPVDWDKTVVAAHPPGFQASLPGAPPMPPPPAPPQYAAAPPLPQTPMATGPMRTPSPVEQLRTQMLDSWRASSPVKRATMVLMPFALVGALFILHDDPPPAPQATRPRPSASSATAVASAKPAADAAAPSIQVVAIATATPSNAPSTATDTNADGTAKATPVAALPAGKRTPEREALDTAAAGAFDDAAKRYDALAVAHPDDPSYKEAARILRARGASGN